MAPAAKQLILGLEAECLSPNEAELFAAQMPVGFILFARNCADGARLQTLCDALRALDPSRPMPILIDQEGGRVARIKPPLAPALPALGKIGALAQTDSARARHLAYSHGLLTAQMLSQFGINVNCAPCLDVAQPDVTWAIGDRSFGGDPAIVTTLGQTWINGASAGGVHSLIKHMPGHGRATLDSHHDLPKVDASLSQLQTTDFVPFKALARVPFGMTSHLQFAAIDPDWPVTQSMSAIREIIRGEIGFDGILFSDDLSMEALEGDIVTRASRALAAGCDLPLHCNGNFAEMTALLAAMPVASDDLMARLNGLLTGPLRDPSVRWVKQASMAAALRELTELA